MEGREGSPALAIITPWRCEKCHVLTKHVKRISTAAATLLLIFRIFRQSGPCLQFTAICDIKCYLLALRFA